MTKHYYSGIVSVCIVCALAIFSSAFVQLGVSDHGKFNAAMRATDATIISDNVLSNDDTLFIPITGNAGDAYIFQGYLEYQASTTADFLMSFSLPAGVTGTAIVRKIATGTVTCSTTGSQESLTVLTNASGFGGVGVGTSCMASVFGYFIDGGTPGNVNLQWSQINSEATNTTLKAGSYLIWSKL